MKVVVYTCFDLIVREASAMHTFRARWDMSKSLPRYPVSARQALRRELSGSKEAETSAPEASFRE